MDDYEKMLREELGKIMIQKQQMWRKKEAWESDPEYQALISKEQEIRKKYARFLLNKKMNEEREKKL